VPIDPSPGISFALSMLIWIIGIFLIIRIVRSKSGGRDDAG
jgi:hypothetical protein